MCLPTVPCWTSCRVALSVVLMLNMAMLYFLRVNLSVAIICMVKTPVGGEDNFSLARSNATALSGYKIDDEGVVTTLNVCLMIDNAMGVRLIGTLD